MDPLGRNTPDGTVWLTIREAAELTGRDPQTIYSWERRLVLTGGRRDDRGRRIYTQQQIADAEKTVRERARRVLGRAA